MMEKRSQSSKMTIMDAVNHLSSITELDQISDFEEFERGLKKSLKSLNELTDPQKEETLQTVKNSFKTVHQYLKHIYSQKKEDLQDIEMQKGVKAIMVLAGEAADKLSHCTTLFKHTYKEGKITEIEEFKKLQTFYLNKIIKRFKQVLSKEDVWEEEWGVEEQTLNIEKLGLRDLETVKRDKIYELFSIRKDDGTPFFNRNLLRHIKLITDFDELMSGEGGDDPLLGIPLYLDQEAHTLAVEIKQETQKMRGEFFEKALKHQNVPIIQMTTQMSLSLFLSANLNHLVKNTAGKTSKEYFQDFHEFLRKILASPDYVRLMSLSAREMDQLSRALIFLLHAYCYAFFTSEGESAAFISYFDHLLHMRHQVSRGSESNLLTFFSDMLEIYDVLTHLFKEYPNGPLFKTLDVFREREKKEGFDPISQGNIPKRLFSFSTRSLESTCLHLPCPTIHVHINKAEVVPEFLGFLSYLIEQTPLQRHVIFNLQDRTSWEEFARCHALESLTNKRDYASALTVVTLSKRTDFYYQREDYRELQSANDFLKIFKEHLESGEEYGYFFSANLMKKDISSFFPAILRFLHEHVYNKNPTLSRKERLDCIELFYLLFFLKVLDLLKPDFFSFTCKDGVDVGAMTAFGFSSMIAILSEKKSLSKSEQEHLLKLAFGPALAVRERAVDEERLSRMVSALSAFATAVEKNPKKVLKALEALYDYPFLQKMQITFNS